jgi:putative OPT family oligopeptide transporter
VTVIATCASISNENLQDLKAGQMVGATPWKQQVVLALGVIVSAFVIGPVLDLLYHAYGIGGVFPHAGMDPAQMLTAPQAGLMASVINGVRAQNLQWDMIIIGAIIAALVIVVDEMIRHRGYRLPALAVGLAIYLPPSILLPVVVGGVVKYFVTRSGRSAKTEAQKAIVEDRLQNGVLMACGLVAGAALMGVILAIPFVMLGNSNALSIMPVHLSWLRHLLGLIAFAIMIAWIYNVSCYSRNAK